MAIVDLSGYISGVSGRTDTLETQMTYVNQDLLQRPDLTAFQAFQSIWNSQIDTVNNEMGTLKGQLKTLQSLYVNLNITVSNNLGVLTGHSGLMYARHTGLSGYLFDILTGHTGTLTGAGVHGHVDA